MLVLVPIALERVLHERNRGLRLLAGFALAASTMAVVLTYSRGGFLALMVTFLAMFIVYPPRIQVMPYLLIIVTVALFFVPKNYYDRILSLQEVFQAPTVGFRTSDFAIRGRASENAAAVAMFRDHPLIGIGLGNYLDLYQAYSRDLGFTPTATERSAHNLYLEVLAETGTIGLVAFLAIVWYVGKTIFKARNKFLQAKMKDYAGLVTAFGIGIFGYLVAAVFIHSSYPRYFYLLIGIAFSLDQVSKNTISQASKS
jgi:O-antigen ligase